MARLTDLPNETLGIIFTHASDKNHADIFNITLVNRRIYQIARPLRVRHWNDEHYYDYGTPRTISKLALELFRHPELRPQVKSLTLSHFERRKGHETPRATLRTENLQMLAEAAKEVVPTMAEMTNLCQGILQGWDDAFAVLILAWAKNLTSLNISITWFDPVMDELLVLRFAKQLALRYNDKEFKPNTQLPLSKLQDLEFRHWDTENDVDARYLTPFLYLPRLKHLTTYRLGYEDFGNNDDMTIDDITMKRCMEDKFGMPIPNGTSSVESISFEETTLSDDGFASLLRAPQRLKAVYIDFSMVLDEDERYSKGLRSGLIHHASTLQKLDLNIDGQCMLEWLEDDGITLQDCYRDLTRLRNLSIPLDHLVKNVRGFHLRDVDLAGNMAVTGRFPESLEYIRIYSDYLWCNWKRANNSEIQAALDGLRALLEETGPEGRLKNLKTLDCRRALVDYPEEEGIQMIKDVAESRGVTLLMSIFPVWPGPTRSFEIGESQS